ncbi:MAG: hypothetical protein COT92_00155 [Candidatus Doudnabacteria bacterium CG10_big_fil_rev_8_21_14_0_10_42_18]|uniref:Uncharacterized protein n=1 Tax=Candidatus Doudnabacteria bacterium CG10_big_fil_rev_8_21_14_0_10_42_18 TaxID=1974552 RepID=A0A2H0VC21_9BACT|nr:MAG: hypothetical protein COT92_00155 [Candidatus Doudnabacteria bacterium CG10_big_fil_rev_8_21_14_0_10_42_18]
MKLAVIVHPNSKKPRIDKDLLGGLNVYVSEPPLEGKANIAVIEALAKYFKVKKYQISLISGQKSKQKVFEIS